MSKKKMSTCLPLLTAISSDVGETLGSSEVPLPSSDSPSDPIRGCSCTTPRINRGVSFGKLSKYVHCTVCNWYCSSYYIVDHPMPIEKNTQINVWGSTQRTNVFFHSGKFELKTSTFVWMKQVEGGCWVAPKERTQAASLSTFAPASLLRFNGKLYVLGLECG